MSYRVSELGKELLPEVERFCQREVSPFSMAWDKGEEEPEAARMTLRALGYQTLSIPAAFGGPGLAPLDTAALWEKIAEADAGLGVMLTANATAFAALLYGGTGAQIRFGAQILLKGGLGAFSLTESEAGSDVRRLAAKAQVQADGSFVLNGTKLFVTNGSSASFYCIAACIEGQSEPSLFVVERGTKGLVPGPQEAKLGIRSCDTCSLSLDHCHVGSGALLGGPEGAGKGMQVLKRALNEGRLWTAVMAVGVGERALAEALAYVKERRQFGQPLADFQAVRFRLARMKTRLEAARQLNAHGLALMEEGKDISEVSAMAKDFAASTAVRAAGEAFDLFGAYAYTENYAIGKILRDARVFPIIEGTAEMQQAQIAAQILGKTKR